MLGIKQKSIGSFATPPQSHHMTSKGALGLSRKKSHADQSRTDKCSKKNKLMDQGWLLHYGQRIAKLPKFIGKYFTCKDFVTVGQVDSHGNYERCRCSFHMV